MYSYAACDRMDNSILFWISVPSKIKSLGEMKNPFFLRDGRRSIFPDLTLSICSQLIHVLIASQTLIELGFADVCSYLELVIKSNVHTLEIITAIT
jgi:hypothetical protein